MAICRSSLSIVSQSPLNQMYALAGNIKLLNQTQNPVPKDGIHWLLGMIREQMDPDLKNTLHGKIYELSSDRVDEANWGEKHAFDSLDIVRQAIEAIALKHLNAMSSSSKGPLFGRIYTLAGCPNTSNPQWGEDNATQDIERLIRALHDQKQIQDPYPPYFEGYETHVRTCSQTYHLGRKEPEHARMGYVNGMTTNYDNARNDALRLSTNVLNECNIYGVHAATSNDAITDTSEMLLQMSGTLTTPVRLIHETWNNFFKNAGSEQRFLQFCHSKGAMHVRKALESLSDDNLRKRIVVFAVAPVILMPEGIEAYHYIIPNDPVPYMLTSAIPEMKKRIENQESGIFILPNQDHPHDLHGPSYQERIRQDIKKFL
jgi:hypothetical protein